MKKAESAIFIASGDAINKPKREQSRLLKQYYCQTPETLLISSRFYWVSDIFGKIGNSIAQDYNLGADEAS